MNPAITINPAEAARLLKRAADCKLPASGLHVLCAISAAEEGTLTMTSTARATGLSCAGITGIADRLQARGLVRRSLSRSDFRVIWLEITDRGRETLAKILRP